MAKAKRRKPGRPKGSKNKAKSSRRKRKATPAQLRNLKKARAARMKNLKAAKKASSKKAKKYKVGSRVMFDYGDKPRVGSKTKKKPGPKSAAYKKRVENLKKARAARELKNMPKTQRMALKQFHHTMMADTVRGPAIVLMPEHQLRKDAPSILQRVRRHMPTLVSRVN